MPTGPFRDLELVSPAAHNALRSPSAWAMQELWSQGYKQGLLYGFFNP